MYISIWTIALIVAVLLFFFKSKQNKEEFSPIRIRIEPKWDDLFKDYDLTSDELWKDKIPQGDEYNLLKKGVTFTILNPNLVYDDDYKRFSTEVSLSRQVDEIVPSKSGWIGFYVKHAIDGYEVGVTNFESRKKSYMPGDGLERIKIATIPYSELLFPLYDRQSKRKKKEIDQNLQKFGWTRQEPDKELIFVCPSVMLEHKYFLVDYEYI